MLPLPVYIPLTFLLTTALCIFWFWQATNKSKVVLFILLSWCTLQSIVAFTGFYSVTNTMPPRFILLAGPAMITIVLLFLFPRSKAWMDTLDLQKLTLLHAVRFPVELVLYWLCLEQFVPELMTFEGRNFDILSGLTAAPILYLVFQRKKLGPGLLLFWNFVCLILLLNIVFLAVCSAPTLFQKFAFEQPNVAVFYFPFVLLPACIVPLVLLSHLVAIRRLVSGKGI